MLRSWDAKGLDDPDSDLRLRTQLTDLKDKNMELAKEESTKSTDREVAEDFRRQLQERSENGSKPTGGRDTFRWLDENRAAFTEVMCKSWGPGHELGMTFTDFKEELEKTPLPSPHDDPIIQSVMRMLCEEVENACQSLGVRLRSGVAYGSTRALEISAEQYSVPFTDASVVSLSSGLITFCSHISKAVSLSLPHEADGDKLRVSFEPKLVLARIGASNELKQYWARVIGAYAFGSGPLDVKHRIVPYPASSAWIQLALAMQRVSVAHEYAHHIAGHGERQVIGAGGDPYAISQEFEADLFALSLERHIGYRNPEPNIFSASGVAATLLLKGHDCVRRVRQIFRSGEDKLEQGSTHPGISERIAAFDTLDEQIPDRNRRDFKKMREDFGTILDEVYSKLKPMFVKMHRQGLRPLGSADDTWLPY
jgi:hypothetical protein